jgi:PEP-CTERM motif
MKSQSKRAFLFGCGLAVLACAVPATANSTFSTSASLAGNNGCENRTAGGLGISSASVEPDSIPSPNMCPDGNSIRFEAGAQSNGTLSAFSEFALAPGDTSGPVTTAASLTATAGLTDTLTFSCAGCMPGQEIGTATLTSTLLGTVFNIGGGAEEYASYTATITDTNPTNAFIASSTAEFCADPSSASPAVNCTENQAPPGNPLAVPLSFAVFAGDSYLLQVTMIAYVQLDATDSTGNQKLASISDPMYFNFPSGITLDTASGVQFPELIPEPSSWMLMGSGLALGLGLVRRRKGR